MKFIRVIVYSLSVFIPFFVFNQAHNLRAFFVEDKDNDTYIAQDFGGNDCVDSLQSQYISNTACNASAQPTFLESKADADSDDDIADHAWIQDDSGLYHLFFQNEDLGQGDYIEHYTSSNLLSLQYVGPALLQNAEAWDSHGLWAPHVIKNPSDNLYYMFYAGVTASGSDPNAVQRIGLATSPDLITWTKYAGNNCEDATGEGCVYDCSESWTRWGLGQPYDSQCRDPFVIRDEDNNRWLMFMTVNSNVGAPVGQMVAVAQSSDLINWSGAGYVQASKRLWANQGGVAGQLTGNIAENPLVTKYNNNYYLFFTDYSDEEDYYNVPNPRTQIQYISSTDLNVDASGSLNWLYRGYIPDPGVNASEIIVPYNDSWIMSQSVSPNGFSGDWPAHTRDLRLKRMIWNEDGTFSTSKLTKLSCRVASAEINPGVTEICNDGLDNDCNHQIDDQSLCGICIDNDNDNFGASGTLQCAQPQIDCNDNNYLIHPGAIEYCNDNVDSNCDGLDNGEGCTVYCQDNDFDGYGVSGLEMCDYAELDCNDENAAIHPGVVERCDLMDNNCDGRVDENNVCPRPKKKQFELCEEPDDTGGAACYVWFN